MANLDFSGIASREALPEGVYNLVIEKVEEKVSGSGNPMFLVRYKEENTGNAIFENYVLNANCLWKLKEVTDALGIDTSEVTDSSEIAEMMTGQMVKAKVIQEIYEEVPRNKVKKVLCI